jgi:hypothetical protein
MEPWMHRLPHPIHHRSWSLLPGQQAPHHPVTNADASNCAMDVRVHFYEIDKTVVNEIVFFS